MDESMSLECSVLNWTIIPKVEEDRKSQRRWTSAVKQTLSDMIVQLHTDPAAVTAYTRSRQTNSSMDGGAGPKVPPS